MEKQCVVAHTGAVSLSNDKQKHTYMKTKVPTREAREGGRGTKKTNQWYQTKLCWLQLQLPLFCAGKGFQNSELYYTRINIEKESHLYHPVSGMNYIWARKLGGNKRRIVGWRYSGSYKICPEVNTFMRLLLY